jgi:hypothetical protein
MLDRVAIVDGQTKTADVDHIGEEVRGEGNLGDEMAFLECLHWNRDYGGSAENIRHETGLTVRATLEFPATIVNKSRR